MWVWSNVKGWPDKYIGYEDIKMPLFFWVLSIAGDHDHDVMPPLPGRSLLLPVDFVARPPRLSSCGSSGAHDPPREHRSVHRSTERSIDESHCSRRSIRCQGEKRLPTGP